MRSIGLPLALLLMTGCQESLAQKRTEAAAPHAAEAAAAIERGELQRALFAAELAAQYDPLDPRLRDLTLRVSLALIAANRPSLTREQFARAAYQGEALSTRDPANRHVYQTVGAIDAFARGEATAAEARLREVTGAKPTYAPAWLMLGDVLQAGGRTREALAAYEAASKLEVENPRVLSNMGMIYAQLGEPAKAVQLLTRALAFEDTAALRVTLAGAYLALELPTDALPHFERATVLDPRDGRHRVSLGDTHLKLGQLEAATAAYRDGATLGAEPWASRGLGAIALKRRDYANANQAFSKVLAMSPNDTATLFLAAEAQEGLSHPAEAAKLYSRFAELAEKTPAEATRVLLAKDRLARLAPPAR